MVMLLEQGYKSLMPVSDITILDNWNEDYQETETRLEQNEELDFFMFFN
jgi:hypothetical protein